MVLSVEWSQNASAHSNGGLAIEALVVILSWLFRHLNHHHRIVGTTMGETSMNPLRYLLACAAWLGLSVVVMGQTTVPAVQLTPAAPAKSVVKELKSDSEINAKDTDDPVRKGSYMKTVTYKMEAGKFYRIDMVSKDEGFDPYLRLEDPAGKLVGQDDDGGGFPHARLIYKAATTGDHKIICTTFGPGMTGKFLLTVVGSSEAELARAARPVAPQIPMQPVFPDAPTTHKQVADIKVKSTDGKYMLQTIGIDSEGRVLALAMVPKSFGAPVKDAISEVQVFGTDGKLALTLKVNFHANAVNGADGTIYIAGDGKVARFDAKGKDLGVIELPPMKE